MYNYKRAYLLVILIILTTLNLNASHLASVDVSSIKLTVKDCDFYVEITKDKKSILSEIIVKLGDKVYSVPKEELSGIGSDFILTKTRILFTSAVPGRVVTAEDLKSIVISIPYGKVTANYVEEYEMHSYNEVRFVFRENNLEQRIRSVTMGDEKSLWQIYSKEVGQKEVKGDLLKGIKNPLGSEIVEN